MESYTERQIIDALKTQDIKMIITLLRSRILDPNYCFPDLGVASMHLVVGYGTETVGVQIMYHLLRHGGDPNLPSDDGITPVHVASSWCRTTILHLLLLYGGDPWLQDEEMRNAFGYAEEAKAWAALEMLHNFQLNKATTNRSKNCLVSSPVKTIDILPDDEIDRENAEKHTDTVERRRTFTLKSPEIETASSSENVNSTFDIDFIPEKLKHLHLENESILRTVNKGLTSHDPAQDDSYVESITSRLTYTISSPESEADCEVNVANQLSLPFDTKNSLPNSPPVNCTSTPLEESLPLAKTKLLCENKVKSVIIKNYSGDVNQENNVISLETVEVASEARRSASSSVESNIMNIGLIESDTSENEAPKEATSSFSSALEIVLGHDSSAGEEARKTYTVKEGKTEFLKQVENKTDAASKKMTLLAKNLCVEKVKLFEKKFKEAFKKSEKIVKPDPNVVDFNKTFTIRQSPDTRADLFAELSKAVSRRSLRMTGKDVMNLDSKEDLAKETSKFDGIGEKKTLLLDINQPQTINNGMPKTIKTEATEVEENTVPSVLPDAKETADSGKHQPVIIDDKSPAVRTPGSSGEDLYISCEGDSCSESVDREESHSDQDDRLRQKLIACGKDVGPVTSSTRAVYQRMLAHIPSTGSHSTPEFRPQQNTVLNGANNHLLPASSRLASVSHIYNFNYQYCPELMTVLQSSDRSLPYESLEANMLKDFSESWQDWRGGSAKTCFNYLLLDERITRNLPARSSALPFQEVTRVFVEAVFYVGKGQAGRPYAHLQSASTIWKTKSVPADPKTAHILSIWKSGCGVVCLHIFHNTISAEAHTREAAMIDGIGRTNIRNLRRGEYYGRAARWTQADQRRLGVRLMLKARDILLSEGERAIRPEDISQHSSKTKK